MKKYIVLIVMKKKIKMFNKWEKIYAILFMLTIALGIIYGFANTNYYKTQEINDANSFLDIFLWNSRIGLMVFFTAGALKFVTNIFTFAYVSSAITTANVPIFWVFLLIHGIPEMLAFFFFGISGIAFFEKIFKIQTNVSIKRFLFLAFALLFVAAILEWYVSIPVGDFYMSIIKG